MKGFALVLALLPLAASAATITVNTTADNTAAGDGHCTLREAIANVNAAADTTNGDCAAGSGTGDSITFNLRLPATIRLAAPKYSELAIAHELTIVGPGADLLAIDGRHRTRVFHITAGTTSLSDLTIQNGLYSSPTFAKGGGILVDTAVTLNLTNCRLIGNKVLTSYGTESPAGGGGIEVAGTATLTSCTISGNTANGHVSGNAIADGYGGGIEVTGAASLTDCTLSDNTANGRSFLGVLAGGHGGGIEIAGSATLINCTFSGNTSGGRAGGNGGGIEVTGTATLTNCTLSGNTANGYTSRIYAADGYGGGIKVTGTATLTDCTLSGNAANGYSGGYGGYGGGIDNTGTATLTNCTLSSNTAGVGGAIESSGLDRNRGTVSLTDCTLSGNTAGSGGGLANDYGTATLTNCTLSGNTGGGIDNSGTATLTDCTLSGNTAGGGGGLANFDHGTATLTNCTLSDNSAGVGGGIENSFGTDATLTNCTLSGNTAAGAGGGLYNDGTASLTNCTLSGNIASTGGGIENNNGHTSTLLNTIVANNQPHDCLPLPTSNGHNLDSDGTCFSSSGTDLINTNPLLAPLANYGGPTETMALCTAQGAPDASCTGASPAINAGDDAVTGPPDNLSTDQRGLPRLSGAHVDIGAYEVQQ